MFSVARMVSYCFDMTPGVAGGNVRARRRPKSFLVSLRKLVMENRPRWDDDDRSEYALKAIPRISILSSAV